jgi:superfamily II DNA or RNA helicase
MRKLTQQEIAECNRIEGVNSRKDYLQNLVIKDWFKKPNGVFIGFTSVGKSYCIAKVIKILNQQKPEATTCIIVPASDLKDDFEKTVKMFDLKNVDVFVINSFSMNLVKNNETKFYDLLVADELHTLCRESSEYFSQVIPRVGRKYFFGVSATLEKEHLEYLERFNLPTFFEIPIEDGFRANVVPEYKIYNIGVDLNDGEKRRYQEIQKRYNSLVSYFTQVNVSKPIDAIQIALSPKSKENEPPNILFYDGRMEIREILLDEFAAIL